MTKTEIRGTIRKAAESRDCKYQITSAGEVHFYGRMPNTNKVGWYLVDQSAPNLAKRITSGEF